MKASKLKELLEKLIAKYGDVELTVFDSYGDFNEKPMIEYSEIIKRWVIE